MTKEIEVVYVQFGAKVRAMREMLGLTQADIAQRVGLERTSVVNIENGKQRVLLDDVEKFAKGFGTTPKHFMKGIWF